MLIAAGGYELHGFYLQAGKLLLQLFAPYSGSVVAAQLHKKCRMADFYDRNRIFYADKTGIPVERSSDQRVPFFAQFQLLHGVVVEFILQKILQYITKLLRFGCPGGYFVGSKFIAIPF